MANPRPAGTASARRSYRDLDGILLLDKSLGLSSNAALQQARALYRAAKAGHAGSLDPLASGLLPVCFGQATKVCGRLLNSSKTYQVTIELGARTESGDCETPIVEQAAVPALNAAVVDRVLSGFVGERQQVPPMHSALKFEGKRLYELARRGESVERAPRAITIHSLLRTGLAPTQLQIEVECSKGTYVRTLAADIAGQLGTLGYVKGLRRLAVTPFGGLPMYTLAQLEALPATEREALLLSPDRVFGDLSTVSLDAAAVAGLLQGRTVAGAAGSPGELRAYDARGRFLGIVERQEGGRLQPRRLFVDVTCEPMAPKP